MECDLSGYIESSAQSQQKAKYGHQGDHLPGGVSVACRCAVRARGHTLLPAPRHLNGFLPQEVTLIARYLQGSGQLDKDTLDALAGFHPTYLCALSPEQLGSVPDSLLW